MGPFSSVLIANRGEIAVRILRACCQLRLRTVAVYSDADANSLHVKLAELAVRIGSPPPAESYLNAEAILEAARKTGAEAIHPGYGFLAEDPSFAERCLAAGLVWIGPSPEAMRRLGDKSAARALAEQLGVPTLPGYHGADQSDGSLIEAAERVGYPLLVKAAAGGGGRGMRRVDVPEELHEALAAARREAQAGFGDDRLLLERLLERPRHVEIQILGDEQGNIVHLGERDCSIQRRHQKIVEEAPAPRFSAELRAGMGEAAVALARAAGYSSAGTAEFLLDEAGRFYFLEMNTRLQVEHPVTEAVTGLDLVQLQLRIAAGERLPLEQADVLVKGHAVEVRLYAEDPWSDFLPSVGRLSRLSLLDGLPGIRIDGGVKHGDTISPYYDPMIAKIVAHGRDRTEALDRLAEALSWVEVEGVRSNLELLEAIVASEAFANGEVHTGFLEANGLRPRLPAPSDDLLIAAAAGDVFQRAGGGDASGDPWNQTGPWRPGWIGAAVSYRHASETVRLGMTPPILPEEPWQFEVGGRLVSALVESIEPDTTAVDLGSGPTRIAIRRQGTRRLVRHGRHTARLELVSGLALERDHHLGGTALHSTVRAPLPGRVARVLVQAGEQVRLNQLLVVLEAMKIEHLVTSPRDGVVAAVRCREGDQVEQNATLVELEEE